MVFQEYSWQIHLKKKMHPFHAAKRLASTPLLPQIKNNEVPIYRKIFQILQICKNHHKFKENTKCGKTKSKKKMKSICT